MIRADESTSITPIVVVTSNNSEKHIIDILKKDVESVIANPEDDKIIYYSVKNIMRLLNSNRTVSPLTGLPGNVQIQSEIKRRLDLGKKFAMLYADLDNFKAYNDTYGFSKGDEIIKFTARILTKHVLEGKSHESNFVGHIGGDDFIAIVDGVITDAENEIGKHLNESYKRFLFVTISLKFLLDIQKIV